MLRSRPLRTGILLGTIYTFEEVGDELPPHAHAEADNHITIVAFGRLECFGGPDDPVVVIEAKAGAAVFAFKVGQPHGFRALTAGASIINIRTATTEA